MNRRYPAEWETQKATWLSFPHNETNWYGVRREKITRFYFDLIEIISRFQPVKVLVPKGWKLPESEARTHAAARFVPEFIEIPTNDIWIRDYGPFFVYEENHPRIATFEFNAWGAKFPPWDKDNKVPEKIADFQKRSCQNFPYIFEGGAIEVNGQGLGMTTWDCLVGKNRNSEAALPLVRKAICDALGLQDLLVLPEGLYGDHTDGHIDNVARFVSPTRVVIASEKNPQSPNHQRLAENRALIETWLKNHYGEAAAVDSLPLPPQGKLGNEVLPASYMNFIYANGSLIFPCYDPEKDAVAQQYFERIYPDRKIIGIDCRTVIEEGGSLHCMSKQEN